MTKKDYELIASAINDMFLGHSDWYRSLSQVSNKLADTLASKNPRFDKQKFLQACGVEVKCCNGNTRYLNCDDCREKGKQCNEVICCDCGATVE